MQSALGPAPLECLCAALVLCTAWLIVHQLCVFRISLDEGIYLHGAERVLADQQIYRDFFALTGPGTFWLYAAWFKIFSVNVAAAHMLLSLEIAAIVNCIYLIINQSLGRLAGIAAASSFLALLMPFSHRLYVNHRWDSACCATMALTVLLLAPKRAGWLAVAGALAGSAAVFTPPVLLVALAVAVLLLGRREERRQALWFAAGVCVPLAVMLAILAWQGALVPMLETFAWVGRHYSQANRVPYGFEPAESLSVPVSALRWITIHLPPVLPAAALGLLILLKVRHLAVPRAAAILLVGGLALAASCYPRVAANNLLFAAPMLLCFLFLTIAPFAKPAPLRTALSALLALSLVTIFWSLTSQPAVVLADSRADTVGTSAREARNIEFATAVIDPGDTLFVYPYQPIWYSLTGGINPTRFDFLQPGMMTLEDEDRALQELMAHPPEWVIWHSLPERTIWAIWPHSDPATLHFRRIEQFIRSRYAQVKPADRSFRYAIAIFHRIG